MSKLSDQRPVVLVVDDEHAYIYKMRQLLEGNGFVVLSATYEDRALELAVGHPDIALTLVDGLAGAAFDMVEEMKKRGLGGRLIAHSLDPGMNFYLKEAGCEVVIPKQKRDDGKVEAIRRILGQA